VRSSWHPIALEQHSALIRWGARRHPRPHIDVPRAGRRAPARLSTTVEKTGLTHTNRSPINPVHFTIAVSVHPEKRVVAICRGPRHAFKSAIPIQVKVDSCIDTGQTERVRPERENYRTDATVTEIRVPPVTALAPSRRRRTERRLHKLVVNRASVRRRERGCMGGNRRPRRTHHRLPVPTINSMSSESWVARLLQKMRAVRSGSTAPFHLTHRERPMTVPSRSAPLSARGNWGSRVALSRLGQAARRSYR
jgi:hypothetical protein